ncbi:MAG TPA: aspartate carbamoyltransferase regulatory subunit [Candidatus Bilamarchaeaceae archaeon]|nr:aspartate carbamoyltransferase regulatory subunit [Candidatus Bilamarchaeaceae archaeon]
MLNVDTIDKGTVVDHIKAGKGRKVLDILGITENYPNRVALVMNVTSKRLGKKDIVKIEGKKISQNLTNMIALICPDSTINQIEDGTVVKKSQVKMPALLEGIGTCPNPNCITNSEHAKPHFVKKDDRFFCSFCERLFLAEELVK